jgi:hypothetical protein
MPQERYLDIFVDRPGPGGDAFDSSTKLTAALPVGAVWTTGSPGDKYCRIDSTVAIGRISPEALGRPKFKHSRVRVFCDGALDPADFVSAVGSDVSGDTLPAAATRAPQIALTMGPMSASVIELAGTDDLQIQHAGNGTGQGTVHIVIYDLDEEQLDTADQTRLLSQAINNTADIEVPVSFPADDLRAASGAVYGFPSPVAGTIVRIQTRLGAVLATGDATLTGRIGGVAITGGVVTITEAGSAVGDVDEAVPTAANTVAVGSSVSFLVGGANTANVGATVVVTIRRT